MLRLIGFFCVVIVAVNTIPSQDIGRTIGYQIHSWNDLREWRQGLMKGARWFKVDPNFMGEKYCETQIRVENSSLGCLLLNHDQPSIRNDYYTADDVVDLIANPDYSNFFMGDETVFIALCFKNVTPCDGSLASSQWMQLVDHLFERANETIVSLGLNVEFLLDGVGTPGGVPNRACLADKWRPWVSTWISASDYFDWNAIFSNDPTVGYDRFQILNENVISDEPAANVKMVADLAYGKFGKQHKYPFLNWEPIDQEPIVEVAAAYVQAGIAHEPGFKFAINQDPVQLQVFTASLSGTAWNERLPNTENHFFPVVHVMYMPDSPIFFIITIAPSMKGENVYQIYTTSLFGDIETLFGPTPLPQSMAFLQTVNSLSSLQLYGGKELYSTTDNEGNIAFFQFIISNNNFDIELLYQDSLDTGSYLFGSALGASGQADADFFAVVYSNANCGLELNVYELLYPPLSISMELVNKSCLVSAEVHAESASVAIGRSNLDPTAATFLIAFSTNKTVHYAQAVVQTDGSLIFVVSSPVDVGEYVRLALQPLNGKNYVLEIHTDGYCYNNEPQNKQPNISLCDMQPKSTPYVLTYNYGLLDAFEKHIFASAMNNTANWITSCNEHILHGSYDMGLNPTIDLFVTQQGTLGMIEIHEGISSEVVDVGSCGLPIPYLGLVVDGWPLPNL